MLGVHELDVHHSPALKNYFYQTYPLKKRNILLFIYIIGNKVCKTQVTYMQNIPSSP